MVVRFLERKGRQRRQQRYLGNGSCSNISFRWLLSTMLRVTPFRLTLLLHFPSSSTSSARLIPNLLSMTQKVRSLLTLLVSADRDIDLARIGSWPSTIDDFVEYARKRLASGV